MPADGATPAIAATADRLYRDAFDWFAPDRTHVPEKTFRVIGRIVAAAAPDRDAEALIPCARFCMWMYLLDYYMDEQHDAPADRHARLYARVSAALDGGPDTSRFLDTSLAALCAMLDTSPAAPVLMPWFKTQVLREVSAGGRLHTLGAAMRAGAPPPAMDAFLDVAAYAVNHMSCSASLLLCLGEALPEAAMPALDRALFHAACAIRIANDLRTHTKDREEGVLCVMDLGLSVSNLETEIRARVARCDEALTQFAVAGGPDTMARGLRQITRLGLDVYAVDDIRYDL